MKAYYVKTKLTSVINITKIVTIHYYEFGEAFDFKGESHDFWEMVYVDKGEVEIKTDDETKVLGQGEVIFHKPNEFHSIKAHRSSPNFFVISFVCNSAAMSYFTKKHTLLGKDLKPFISAIIKEAETAYVIPPNDPSLKELVKKEGASVGSEQLIKTYLEQLLIMLLRLGEKKQPLIFPSKESLQSHLLQRIKQLIEENLDKSLQVTEICKAVGYSKTYLSKLFHEQSGYTLAHYIVLKKISAAKEMIREGRLNFSEISERLDFDNPQYFSRVFKRVAGMTPTEFKNSLSRS